ncbi:MAG: flagellar hook-associated protein FlgL [Burkholderiales bacterium]|jgi:flagellar hook-associated protein 3 FlgL
MRIGTAYSQQMSIDGIAERQSRLADIQAQLSSGRRVNSPADDPVAAAEAERLRSKEARIDSEKRAASLAQQVLSSADSALGDANDVLQSAREALLAAGTATAGPGDRAKQAEALRQLRDQLLSIANRGDGTGGYLFGGQGALTAPIDSTGTLYTPPAGTSTVGQQQQNPVSLDGRENFTAIRTSTGTESVFSRLDAAITTLSNPATTSAQAVAIAGTTVDAVDRAMDRLSTTRTMVGERLKAIDAHTQALESGSIENQSRLSQLVDVDFAKAVSDLTQNQTALEAAMKSYAQISKMSLFDYV